MSEPVDEQTQHTGTVGIDETAINVRRRPRAVLLEHWKIYLFTLFAIASLFLGFVFKAKAKPPSEGHPTAAPQIIEVFTTDPEAQVELAVSVFSSISKGHPDSILALYLSITPSIPGSDVSWIILSYAKAPPNHPTIPVRIATPDGKPFPSAYAYGDLAFLERSNALEYQSPLRDNPFPGTALAATIHIPSTVATEVRGNLYAHLPHVGPLTNTVAFVPLIVELSTSTGKPLSAIIDPSTKTPRSTLAPAPTNPAQYIPSVPGALPYIFYEPQTIKTTAQLLGAARFLQDSQSTAMVPPGGQVQGDDLIWTGNQILEPTVKTTSIGDAEIRSSFDFYSGIALATAAAALIAAVQELPAKLPLQWMRRRLPEGDQQVRQVEVPPTDQSPQPSDE